MAKISGLPDELLMKILSFLPTKVAVSTSVLSKQWEFLWMWLPKLEFDDYHDYTDINHPISSYLSQDFIHKNLPLYRAHIIESLRLRILLRSLQPNDFESWVGIVVSRYVHELSISYFPIYREPYVLLPSSLYTCESLVTLKLEGYKILVDVSPIVCLLPSLKTLELRLVRYLNEDSLQKLLKCCPILENLSIQRVGYDNLDALVINVPSLQRLSLLDSVILSYGCVIVTPSLKYFTVRDDCRESFSIEHMPELEEAHIIVPRNPKELLKSLTSTRRLSLRVAFNSAKKTVYRDGIVFNRLEKLELFICNDNWSKLLVQLLKDSPKLQILNLIVDDSKSYFVGYKPVSWDNNHESSVPTCLLKSLETFKFSGYKGRQEERDFLSFIFKHARCLKSTSILG